MITIALALLQVATASGAPVDEGVLVVRVDTQEVARESFRLSRGHLSRGGDGWTLATTIRYDRTRPVIVLAPIIEVNTDTLPATLQYDVADPRQPSRILGELGRGRFTVRSVARATERAREFPTGQRPVVLDDSVFALYLFAAWLAPHDAAGGEGGEGRKGGSLTAIFPRALRRDVLEVADRGMATTTLNRDPARLRHVVVGPDGPAAVHLWLDEAGRLMKVDIPARHLTAERLAGS